MLLGRRDFIAGLAGVSALVFSGRSAGAASGQAFAIGERLPRWSPGKLDIHFLATGRGDATVIVAPGGRVALIDAGATVRPDPALVEAPQGAAEDTGRWIAEYVKRLLAETGGNALDAAVITHLHPDHVGAVLPVSKPRPGEIYQPTGISSVAQHVPLRKLVDPCFPDYGYPPLEDRASNENYIAFARALARSGIPVEKVRVGGTGQILPDLVGPAPFSIRCLSARGRAWSGTGTESHPLFPSREDLAHEDWPNENAMSAAFLLKYGAFRFFFAGDLTDWADAGTRPWMNALTTAARLAGPVNVAALPHHGMYDGSGPETISALAARDWIISAWHAVHPSIETLERVYNDRLYPGERDVWSTALHPAAELAMERLTSRFASKRGNIICRVAPGGHRYQMVATDPSTEEMTITAVADHYPV